MASGGKIRDKLLFKAPLLFSNGENWPAHVTASFTFYSVTLRGGAEGGFEFPRCVAWRPDDAKRAHSPFANKLLYVIV